MKKLLILSLIFLSLPTSVLADGSSSAFVPTDKILIGDTVQTPDGTLWFIDQDGKAPYPSEVVFNTYRFNSAATIKKVTEKQLKTFSTLAPVPPQDGKVYLPKKGNNAGTYFYIGQGQKYAFSSADVVEAFGYLLPKAIEINLDGLPTGGQITTSDIAHKPGTFINNDGVVQLIGPESRLNIANLNVFYSWGYSFIDIVPANKADLQIPEKGDVSLRGIGQLNPLKRINLKFGVITQSEFANSGTTPTTSLISSVTESAEQTIFSNAIILPNSSVVKTPHSPQVWYVTSRGYKKPIPSITILESYQTSLSDVETISQEILDNYTTVPCVKIFGNDNVYQLLPKGKKLLSPDQKGEICPYPEQILEINKAELNSYANVK